MSAAVVVIVAVVVVVAVVVTYVMHVISFGNLLRKATAMRVNNP